MSEFWKTTWARQDQWDELAVRVKKQIAARRLAVMALTSFGVTAESFAGLVAAEIGPEGAATWLGFGGALCFAFAAAVTARGLTPADTERWARARSASEGLKSEMIRYATRTGAYAGESPAQALLEARDRILDEVEDLREHLAPQDSGSGPGSEPDFGPELGADDYIRLRVEDQIGWYRRKAGDAARTRDRWRAAELGLFIATTVFATAAAYIKVETAGLVSIVAVLATAVGSHIAAWRFDHVARSYRVTADRLEDLRDAYRAEEAAGRQPAADGLVDACEAAIGAENAGWMAARVKRS